MQFKLLPILALVFGLTQTLTAAALPSPALTPRTTLITASDAASLEEAFTHITAIPDSVLLAGDLALDRYLVNAGLRSPTSLSASLQGDAFDCAVEIGKFLIGNVFLAGKILRIKKIVDALGGATKAAQLLVKATTPAQRLAIGGAALKELFEEISGAKDVVDACS